MPKPVYILLAHNIVQDKDTNLLSVSGVIERVDVRMRRAIEGAAHNLHRDEIPFNAGMFKLVAVWMREPEDVGVDFEHKFSIEMDGAEPHTEIRPYAFSGDQTKTLQRIIVTLRGFPIPATPGIVLLKSSLRRVGSENWVSQQYPVQVNIYEIPAAEEELGQQAAGGCNQ